MTTTEIATAFVELARRYDWRQINSLSEEEVGVLLATVSAAGFEEVVVVPGRIVEPTRDLDGTANGGSHTINGFCPFKAVGQDGQNHHRATVWLDQAMQLAREGTDSQAAVAAVVAGIERSVPLKPIPLTIVGDKLQEYPPTGFGLVDHTRDSHRLSSCVGIHACCGGWMDRKRTSPTHDVLVCRNCCLRVVFPRGIETYGDLRRHMEEHLG